MLLKWFVTGLIVFGIYRYFIQPKALDTTHSTEQQPSQEGEFIDYEEVD
ncbi:MAG: hypothetical protein AAF738_01265 [Bacteroidota bacterium]